ncbi:MAG: sigma-70 family RNA polymerase sigma factor [Candidatus Nanopelagicales bacterium]
MIPGRAFEDLVRRESGQVIGGLLRRFGDFDLAEDAYADAVLAAWEHWPHDGVPANPGAWLSTTARNKALDRIRRETRRPDLERRADADRAGEPAVDDQMFASWALDDRLHLLFLCCHPALSQAAQVALTLRSVAGLTTSEIARAFVVPESTMAQRLVRAKRKIAAAGIPFGMPAAVDLPERVEAVCAVVYLVFNEGYASTGANTVVRADLCAEAERLAHLMHRLLPDDSSITGLLALIVLHDARRAARLRPDGRYVPLEEQDRRMWDAARIAEGERLAEQGVSTGALGPYQLQAAIAALHATAPSYDDTDWPQILALYDIHERVAPGPVVTLNRAVALAMCEGPAAALAVVRDLEQISAAVPEDRLLAVKAHLLERDGQIAAARDAYGDAALAAATAAERQYLLDRRDRLVPEASQVSSENATQCGAIHT